MRISDCSSDVCSSDLLSVGTGVRVVGTQKLFTQGNISQTNNALDIAVQGRGFFEVLLPDGTQAYTRDGTFQVDSDGQLVTSSGYRVQPEITLPANAQSVTIGSDGVISVSIAGQAAAQQVRSEEHTSELQSLMRISYA